MSTRTRRSSALLLGLLALLSVTCDSSNEPAANLGGTQAHSSALALDPTGTKLFVAHPDADSVSLLALPTRKLVREVVLGARPPARDEQGHYTPLIGPRTLALDPAAQRLYVTGQRSGHVYALDATTLRMLADQLVCSEPIGVLVSADGASVFVACSQDDEIVQLNASDLTLRARVPCARKPWTLAWAADGSTLLATHLLGPGISSFATQPLALTNTWNLADGGQPIDTGASDELDPSKFPHGVVRGIYDVLARPHSSELWTAHIMLGIDTPQPKLDFQRTAFPALSILDSAGTQLARLSVQAGPGDHGAFGDVVSGPHALAFSDDGSLAFVVDANSEDVLVVDADQRIEAQLVRPLPGHGPEAILWSAGKLYIQLRNSESIAVYSVERGADDLIIKPDGPAFTSLGKDPMPAPLRLGQKLFYSANSDDAPMTQNHWLACASCHLEGRSDAVTWQFAQGPRDTPTNAGGMLDTGFLFRTADRTRVQDYWQTINIEQGGHFSANEPAQQPALDALADYVNYAIPTPVPPSRDASHAIEGRALMDLRTQGRAQFERLHCDNCHSGIALTDSGSGNSELDLSGPVVSRAAPGGVLLHDVGTCAARGDHPDVEHANIQGEMRAACAFDTPQLRGLWDSAPYLHDGSAATLEDTLPSMLRAATPPGETTPVLAPDEQRALIEYLRSL